MISSPFVIILSDDERAKLNARAHSATTAHREVIRARIILAAADGQPNAEIADGLGVHVGTARKWRRRFHDDRLPGLKTCPGRGGHVGSPRSKSRRSRR